MFCQRVRVCQWRVCVSQPEVWWTWQLSGRLRWGQCSLTLLMQMINVLSSGLCRFKMCLFQWPGAHWLKRRTFSAWHFKDMSCSFLPDWLREGVQGGWVPLPEPRSLHPSALALRWRVWLHGPQWRGKLQPRCGWWFMMQRKNGTLHNSTYFRALVSDAAMLLCTECNPEVLATYWCGFRCFLLPGWWVHL